MRVLITGSSGFIGSHLLDHYISKGVDVVGVDNFSTGQLSNIQHHFDNPLFTSVCCDVSDRDMMKEQIKGCDMVFHLAAPVGVKLVMEKPVHTLLDNMRGIDVVLDLCNTYRKKVFIASTSEVYGKNLDFLDGKSLNEDSYRVMGSTKVHRWAYANTKAYDELLAFAYHKEYGLPVVVGRFFNTVGPRQVGNYGMVIPRFFGWAWLNSDIKIYGDGNQTRCFLDVSDAVSAVVKLMETKNACGDVFNIGNTEEVSMTDLARKIIELTKSKSNIEYVPYKDVYGDGFEDMMKRTPDISKIEKLIGWKPKHNLNLILKRISGYEV